METSCIIVASDDVSKLSDGFSTESIHTDIGELIGAFIFDNTVEVISTTGQMDTFTYTNYFDLNHYIKNISNGASSLLWNGYEAPTHYRIDDIDHIKNTDIIIYENDIGNFQFGSQNCQILQYSTDKAHNIELILLDESDFFCIIHFENNKFLFRSNVNESALNTLSTALNQDIVGIETVVSGGVDFNYSDNSIVWSDLLWGEGSQVEWKKWKQYWIDEMTKLVDNIDYQSVNLVNITLEIPAIRPIKKMKCL